MWKSVVYRNKDQGGECHSLEHPHILAINTLHQGWKILGDGGWARLISNIERGTVQFPELFGKEQDKQTQKNLLFKVVFLALSLKLWTSMLRNIMP